MSESGLVIPRVERSRPVEVDSRTGMNAAYGDQTERWRLQRFATLQSIVQCPGNESAYADASGFCCPTHLLRKLVVKRDCGSHDSEHNLSSSTHNTIKHPSPVSVSLTLGRHSERSTGSGRLVLRQLTGKGSMSWTSFQPAPISKANSPIPGPPDASVLVHGPIPAGSDRAEYNPANLQCWTSPSHPPTEHGSAFPAS